LLTLCARDWRKLEAAETPSSEYGASRQALQPSARTHVYEVRPRKDRRGFDLMSDVLPFGRLWYDGPNAVTNAIGYAMHYSRSHDAVIRVYDDAGNVIETHEHAGEFKEP
jgi:hypothetical protein